MSQVSSKLRKLTFGYAFYCPGCQDIHQVWVDYSGQPQRPNWGFNDDVEAPTFTLSLLVTRPGSVCHSFITDGNIQFLGDCTHALAGQTVPMPDMPASYTDGSFSWGGDA